MKSSTKFHPIYAHPTITSISGMVIYIALNYHISTLFTSAYLFLKMKTRQENHKSPEAKIKKKENIRHQAKLNNWIFFLGEHLNYNIRNLTSLWNHNINHFCLYCLVAHRYSESLVKQKSQLVGQVGTFIHNYAQHSYVISIPFLRLLSNFNKKIANNLI